MANFFSQFNDVMMEMTSTVMLAAPIGVFCLIAKTFSGIGFSAFLPRKIHDRSIAGTCNPMLWRISDFDEGTDWFESSEVPEEICSSYELRVSTATSNATIPLSIETLDEKFGVSRKVSSFYHSVREQLLIWMEQRSCRAWRLYLRHRRMELC